ncbi:sigma-70 family RNA polymerase sigma factor [Sinosporangium siamense]|uniref:RNA polymerase sigma factor n=1 Tax=Sinosporangium siamense TaxID=1367973 RepID=A0A919RPL9_9ACTN|nr:sigma-70 family RNA polymerase sigma factor [Sinosporangium siamense]GII97600.1 RNA polymerase sigma factor [Sinosporangium siamense]
MHQPAPHLLAAAKSGDREAFGRLVEPLSGELHAHCYRMLGSTHDADDAVQETLLRAWRSLDRFEDRGSIRPWLYKIATNRCLTMLERRSRLDLPTDLSPEMYTLIDPYPEAGPEEHTVAKENLELAFVAALQYLTGTQRAVLLLREVLGFSAAEVAGLLDTTAAAVNSALQRARKVTLPQAQPTGPEVADLARRYAEAWEAGDVEGIVAMLSDDAKYSMPPLPEWFHGHAAIREFLLSGPIRHRWRFVQTTANGQIAFGTYIWDEHAKIYSAAGLDVLAVRGGRIVEVVSYLQADLTDFALPESITAT